MIGLHGHHPVPPDPGVVAATQPAAAALAYAAREVVLQVVLPLLALWLLQRWLLRLEERTREEVHVGVAAARRSGAAGGGPSLARELADALPIAASAPSRVALAALTASHVARSLANIAQGLLERAMREGWLGGPFSQARLLGGRTAELVEGFKVVLARVDQGLIVAYQVLLVGFATWVLLSWKDVALSCWLLRSHDTAAGRQDLERILTPLNTVATWAVLVAAALLCVSLLGFDVRPLLVVTGGSGVVAGLASQQLLSNAVSGAQMYLDRPFRVGDTIAVTSGMTTYVGEVVEVAALRTHLALEDGSTVAIPNRALSDMIITNRSRTSRGLNRPAWLESRAPLTLQLRLRLRPATYDLLPAELADLKAVIAGTGAVEAEGPLAPRLEVLAYSDRGVEVLARVRLRNPSKMAAAAASGNVAPAAAALAAAPPPPQQLAAAAGLQAGTAAAAAEAGGGSSGSRAGGAGPPGSAAAIAAAAATTTAPPAPIKTPSGGDGHSSHGDGSGGGGGSGGAGGGGGGAGAGAGGGARSNVDAVRALRQQLLVSLGPWMQSHNATLVLD